MVISDHFGKPYPFSSDCLVTENKKKPIPNAAVILTFSEKQSTKFSKFAVIINDITLSPLNGVYSRYFLNHIKK